MRATTVGVVLQGAERNLLPYLTAEQNVRFAQRAARAHGVATARPARRAVPGRPAASGASCASARTDEPGRAAAARAGRGAGAPAGAAAGRRADQPARHRRPRRDHRRAGGRTPFRHNGRRGHPRPGGRRAHGPPGHHPRRPGRRRRPARRGVRAWSAGTARCTCRPTCWRCCRPAPGCGCTRADGTVLLVPAAGRSLCADDTARLDRPRLGIVPDRGGGLMLAADRVTVAYGKDRAVLRDVTVAPSRAGSWPSPAPPARARPRCCWRWPGCCGRSRGR